TFAIFGAVFVNDVDKKKDSFPCLMLQNQSVWKGVHDVVVAQSGGADALALLYSIYPADFSTGDVVVRGIRADAGAAHGDAHVVDGAVPDLRALQRLSPRLLPRPL